MAILKKIALGSDHAGFELKEQIKKFLLREKVETFDFGTNSMESVDYPDYVHPLAKSVEAGEYDAGIIICGSGNGVNMTANKYKGIRSALCWQEEIAELARLHNDANILAMPARFITAEEAQKITVKFINTQFEGGRHLARVEKICKK